MEHHCNISKVTVRIISIKKLIRWCKKKNTLILNNDLNSEQCVKDIMEIKKARKIYNIHKKNHVLKKYIHFEKNEKKRFYTKRLSLISVNLVNECGV